MHSKYRQPKLNFFQKRRLKKPLFTKAKRMGVRTGKNAFVVSKNSRVPFGEARRNIFAKIVRFLAGDNKISKQPKTRF